MREIKFRAWQKYHKRMLQVENISFKNGVISSISTHTDDYVIPADVIYTDEYKSDFWLTDERGMCLDLMQFTGLKDKNGKEIYEGDVIILNGNDNPHVVEYTTNGTASFIFRYKNCVIYNVNDSVVKVIGNIHENAELLPEADA